MSRSMEKGWERKRKGKEREWSRSRSRQARRQEVVFLFVPERVLATIG